MIVQLLSYFSSVWLSVAMVMPNLSISATQCTGTGLTPGESSSQTEHEALTFWISALSPSLGCSWILASAVSEAQWSPLPPISPVEISVSFNTFFYSRVQTLPTL